MLATCTGVKVIIALSVVVAVGSVVSAGFEALGSEIPKKGMCFHLMMFLVYPNTNLIF
jgi:hypothetical protein